MPSLMDIEEFLSVDRVPEDRQLVARLGRGGDLGQVHALEPNGDARKQLGLLAVTGEGDARAVLGCRRGDQCDGDDDAGAGQRLGVVVQVQGVDDDVAHGYLRIRYTTVMMLVNWRCWSRCSAARIGSWASENQAASGAPASRLRRRRSPICSTRSSRSSMSLSPSGGGKTFFCTPTSMATS